MNLLIQHNTLLANLIPTIYNTTINKRHTKSFILFDFYSKIRIFVQLMYSNVLIGTLFEVLYTSIFLSDMKNLLVIVLSLIFISSLHSQDDMISIANLARKVEGLNIGDKAPDFVGTDAVTGANIQLNRYRGNNNVLLMFYSNALYAASEGSDAPLRQGASDQIAQLIEGMMNSADPKNKTLKIILITGDTQEQIKALINQNPNLTKTMNIIRDEGSRIMDKYNSSFKINKNHPEVKELVSRGLLRVNPKDEYVTGVVPIMYLINREGRITAQFSALNFERLQEAGVDTQKSVAFSLNYITSKITEW